MKHIRILSLVTLVLVLLAGSAFADTFTLTGTGGVVQGSVYVAPYYLSVTSGTTTTNYSVMCDSFYNQATVGSSWAGTANTGSTLSQSKFGNPSGGFDAVKAYTEAAWLFTKLGVDAKNPTTAGGTNYAVWSLFRPAYATPLDGNEDQMYWSGLNAPGSTASTWLDLANRWYGSASLYDRESYLDRLLIFTPDGATNTAAGTQEYLAMSPVPEPGGFLLLGTGLAGAIGVLRRKILG